MSNLKLSAASIKEVRAMVAAKGLAGAATHIGIARNTMLAAIAGMPVRTGTIERIEKALAS